MLRREFLAAAAAAPLLDAAPKIRVGCQTRVYGVPIKDRQKLLAVLDDLKETGYEGFETNFASLEAAFGDPAPLRAEFAKRVPMIGLHLGARLMNPATLEKEQAQIARVSKAVKDFGGEYLVLSGSGVPRTPDGKLDPEVFRRKAAQLDLAAKVCRDAGIRLASHNHLGEAANNGAEMAALLDATKPDVQLLLDIGHAYLAKMDAPPFIRKYGKRIAGFHVRDYRGKVEVPMGTGEVDLAGFARAVAETRWSGWMILEMDQVRGAGSRELVEGARAYMREKMKF